MNTNYSVRRKVSALGLTLVLAFIFLVPLVSLSAHPFDARSSAESGRVSIMLQQKHAQTVREPYRELATVASATLPESNLRAPQASRATQGSPPSIAKSSSAYTVTFNEDFTYTVIFTVPAGTTISNVMLIDILPDNNPNTEPNIVYLNGTAIGPTPGPGAPGVPTTVTVSNGNRRLEWSLDTISNASGSPFVYTTTYRVRATGGPNRVEVGSNNVDLLYFGGSVNASAPVTVVRAYPLPAQFAYSALDTTASANNVEQLRAGDVVTFTIFVTNSSVQGDVSTAYDMSISDTLPSWLVYGSVLPGTPAPDAIADQSGMTVLGWHATTLGGSVAELNALDLNMSITPLQFTATVTSTVAAGRQDNNRVRVTWRDLPGDEPPVVLTNNALLRSGVVSLLKREVDALDPQGKIVVNETITYTIDITIPAGTTVYSPAYVLDTLNDGLNFDGEVLHSPLTLDAVVTPSGNNTQLTWNLTGTITAASDVTMTFVFTAHSDGTFAAGPINKGQTLNNNALMRWNIGTGSTVNNPLVPQFNRGVQFVRPEIRPAKSSIPASAIPAGGAVIEYRIQNVRNGSGTGDTSAAIAYDVYLTDTLPAGFTLFGAIPAPDGIFTVGNTVVLTWSTVPSLPIGYFLPGITTTNVMYVISATAPITLSAGTKFTNTFVTEYSDQPGAAAGEQTYFFTTTKVLAVDFIERISVVPQGQIRIGDLITYTITDTVPPGSIVYWPQHRDDLPRGVHFVSGTMTVDATTLVSSSIPITVALVGPRQERVLWWTETMSNLFGTEPLVVTSTFVARLTGIDTSGQTVYSSTGEFRGLLGINNRPRIEWNTVDVSGPLPVFANSINSSANQLVQPYLTDSIFSKRFGSSSSGSTTVGASDVVTYHIVISNTGRGNAYDLAISDVLPLGMEYVGAVASGRAFSGTTFTPSFVSAPAPNATGAIGWVLDTILPGDGNTNAPTTHFTLTYSARVLNSVGAAASLQNQARIVEYSSLPGAAAFERLYNFDVAAVQSVTLQTPSAVISKSVVPTTAGWFEPITYTLIFPQPPISATLYNVTVTDTVPAGITVTGVTASGGVGTQVGFSASLVTATATSVAPLSQIIITITGAIESGASGTLNNTAILEWDDAATGGSHHTDISNVASVTVLLPDVQVTKSAPATVLPGNDFVYTIMYSNIGTATANGVRIEDNLPDDVLYQAYSASSALTLDAQPDPLNWDVGTLAAGQSETLLVTVTLPITTPLGTFLTNTVSISTVTAGDIIANNNVTVTSEVGGAQLALVKLADLSAVDPAGTLVYTIEYSNTGASAATGVVVSETYDANVSFVAANPAPDVGNNVWNTPSTLNVGERRTIVVTVTAAPALLNGLLITNTVNAYADNAPAVQATKVVTVNSAAVLTLDKSGYGATLPGNTMVYRLTYANIGNAPATNSRLTETYPTELIFVSANPAPTLGNNVWDLGTLTPPVSGTIVVTLNVGAAVPIGTIFTNTVVLDSVDAQPVSDTLRTVVGPIYIPILFKNYLSAPNLVVQNIVVTPASPTANQSTVISVTIVNSGTQTALSGFWLDLYVDPSGVPQPGQPWNAIAPFGKAWVLRTSLAPGQSITLDTTMPDDPDNPAAVYSNWPGWFTSAGSHTLYAQVDAFGGLSGLVVELDESDNLFGPLTVTVNPDPAANLELGKTPTPHPPIDPRSP